MPAFYLSFSHSSFSLSHCNLEYHSYLVHVQLVISKCLCVQPAVTVSGYNLNFLPYKWVAKILFLATAVLFREGYISFASLQVY